MLHVTPEYIVVVSNPAEIIVDEDASEIMIILPLRGNIAAKRTSRESWQRFRQRKEFEWTKITGGIRFWPQFMDDEKCVLDEHDQFTVLTEWESRKFFDVQGRVWAFTGSLTVPPRKTSDCDLLQLTRDAFGDVAERPSSGIRYLSVHCDISALMQTNHAKEAEVPVRGSLQTTKCRMRKWRRGCRTPVNGARCEADWAATKSLRVQRSRREAVDAEAVDRRKIAFGKEGSVPTFSRIGRLGAIARSLLRTTI